MNAIDRALRVANYCDKDAETVGDVYPKKAEDYRADATAIRKVVAELQELRALKKRVTEINPIKAT